MNRRNFFGLGTGVAAAITSFKEENKNRDKKKLRLWKLGSDYMPASQASIDNLTKLLLNINGKSDVDIIWPNNIEVVEFDISEEDVNRVLVK